MGRIAYIDTEVDPQSGKILDIGGISDSGYIFHSNSVVKLMNIIKFNEFLCGHNIIHHDLKYIQKTIRVNLSKINAIDTLYLSPLLFPKKPYHALLKDDKLQTNDLNNPLNDSIKARDLLSFELIAFHKLEYDLKQIYYLLLGDKKEFKAFFQFVNFNSYNQNLVELIQNRFYENICNKVDLKKLITQYPIELAYSLAIISTQSYDSLTPPWVQKQYPKVENIIYLLRNNPCISGCNYCNKSLNALSALQKHFHYSSFRTFDGKALQEEAINAAINNESIIAVFPTGGGKSLTFQIPALMSGDNVKGLTVVISPLQSLMKDQVDNLEKKSITRAVAINGLLDPIERKDAFERVENGSASILYISPESLRSKSIERILLKRNVVRFVIDEAHCFSSWGHDFRVDYLYIGDFIKSFQEKKNLEYSIPVSCFTATAKQNVIDDIKHYFNEKLSLRLKTFSASSRRENLNYKVIPLEDEKKKYLHLRSLLNNNKCPTIVYVSRTKKAHNLAQQLSADGHLAKAYHGKMDKQEKSNNQDDFINGKIDIIVATSAFGMGVDKDNVKLVVHYELSSSLENYVQEAGRAGRDDKITADCYVFYNEEDLSQHFTLLNQTKLNIKEIQQIWKAIKNLTKLRSTVSNSALEIARAAGWDDNIEQVGTRVTTAISALERSGYLKRGQNMPRVYADGILSKNANDAIKKIKSSNRFDERQSQYATLIIQKLFSSRSKQRGNSENPESRIDYLSDQLGIKTTEAISIVNLLREEKILADSKDLSAFIRYGEKTNRSLKILNSMSKIEKFLLSQFEEEEKEFHIKELNEIAEINGCKDISPNKIKKILNYWEIKNWIKRTKSKHSPNHISVRTNYSNKELLEKIRTKYQLAQFIVKYLYNRSNQRQMNNNSQNDLILIEFSVHELREEYLRNNPLFTVDVSISNIEDALLYLQRIDAIKIEGGFLVVYNKLTIERREKDNKIRYKAEDYKELKQFYENKIQQIHIVGEYANKMIKDTKDALKFVDDYFQLNYSSFLQKYFKGSRKDDINRNITPAKFKKLFGSLSPAQLNIIKDNSTQHIAVTAGPGSGKTRVLVHKLASLLLMEDVKHEQLLMVTFSRAAATEFKTRLYELINNAAAFIEIKTFHSYCFDLLGKIGNLETSDKIIEDAVDKIKSGDIETSRITKAVLVIDEAQDMSKYEYELVKALMNHNEDMRVIAVGDDDQNIYEFRGSSSKYLEQFINEQKAKQIDLIVNFRSKENLIMFSNQFVNRISNRLKSTPIISKTTELGNIRLIKHQSTHLAKPVIKDILASDLKGSTCVLTQRNDDAQQLTGLLNLMKIPAKLIQSNDGFNLYNLLEIRFLINQFSFNRDQFIIPEETWESAIREFNKTYKNSPNYEFCNKLIKSFELSNPEKKYISDFKMFIRESKIENFSSTKIDTIMVSTIHKAKGKEFDNVILMLNKGFPIFDDEQKRVLYVAMTRAKSNLTIHLSDNYLDDINCQNLDRFINNKIYSAPNLIIRHLTHRDIKLGDSEKRQISISKLNSGAKLNVDIKGCYDLNGNCVLKFSQNFINEVASDINMGYKFSVAKVNYIVYWTNKNTKKEIKIVLPEIKLIKNNILENTNPTIPSST